MKITLTKKETEEYFFNSIVNGLNYFCSSYGFQYDYSDKEYSEARKKLKDPCLEDVLMQLLRDGNKINFIDVENSGEYSKDVDINMIHENVSKAPANHLLDMANENDDAVTADVIIQCVLFNGEIIFG